MLHEIYRRDRPLALAGWLHLIMFAGMLCIVPFDERSIMGVNPWIKPMKFSASIAIYLWTLAWFLHHLRSAPRWTALIRWGAITTMIVEIVCIATQAARGTTSHYNNATAFDGSVFAVMGIMILLNTLAVAVLALALFIVRTDLSPAYLWALRLGTLGFLLGSLEGVAMLANNAHTIGAPDGGPGLPFLNWSTAAGDLRVAHSLGLHAFQILPLFGFMVSRWRQGDSAGQQVAYVIAFSAVYLLLAAHQFQTAMQGLPLVR